MKNLLKLIKRSVGGMLVVFILIVILNVGMFMYLLSGYAHDRNPWREAEETSQNLKKIDGEYVLSPEMERRLKNSEIWAVLIEDESFQAVWRTENSPTSLASKFTPSEISQLSLGYVKGYPTFTSRSEYGLVVLGFPKDSYWKLTKPSWSLGFIKRLPVTILVFCAVNLVLLALIYLWTNSRLMKSLKPIAEGITVLPDGERVKLCEKGMLKELAEKINRASEIINRQRIQIRKKDAARANWISGVSHDIRTPLSMVMGHTSRILSDDSSSESVREKAEIVKNQSTKIKELINDINLVSRLEYHMQPLKKENIRVVKLLRNYTADLINEGIHQRYNIELETGENHQCAVMECDQRLIIRAINNLVRNSINHNPEGCSIKILLQGSEENIIIAVEDDGVGMDRDKLNEIESKTHYMESTDENLNLRHGLGLLLVRQIVEVHGGKIEIESSVGCGIQTKMEFCGKII